VSFFQSFLLLQQHHLNSSPRISASEPTANDMNNTATTTNTIVNTTTATVTTEISSTTITPNTIITTTAATVTTEISTTTITPTSLDTVSSRKIISDSRTSSDSSLASHAEAFVTSDKERDVLAALRESQEREDPASDDEDDRPDISSVDHVQVGLMLIEFRYFDGNGKTRIHM
jgi:hypothetical protein